MPLPFMGAADAPAVPSNVAAARAIRVRRNMGEPPWRVGRITSSKLHPGTRFCSTALEPAQLLSRGLQEKGYQTDVLTTAAEARDAVAGTRYAALVLDLGLPDGDGLSILREIRQRKDPVPVLVLTARGGVHDRVNGLR